MRKSDYHNLLRMETNPYSAWIDLYEEKGEHREIQGDVSASINALGYRVIMAKGGSCSPLLYDVVAKTIEESHPDIIYTDEDVCTDKRYSPYFKPDFSPDTLKSFFYLGGLVIVKNSIYDSFFKENPDLEMVNEINEGTLITLKRLVLSVFYKNYSSKKSAVDTSIVHIPKVLFHADKEHSYKYPSSAEEYLEKINPHKISAIILSKDNLSLLRTNISSLLRSLGKDKADEELEIIVVDNGSIDDNRKQIEEFLESKKVKYIYNPMAFEYSTLCNIGAKASSGDVLLFLNDDVVFAHDDDSTVLKMLSKAMKPYVGAVGIKLYYPDENVKPGDDNLSIKQGVHRIQHIGISLMLTGPSHKLQTYPDDKDYYFGRNLVPYNVLAVTGAVLMVEKAKFESVGGFDEGLKVAYTDADLCSDLLNKGFYNLCLNDISAFHFESISRGDDVIVKEKANRLKKERSYFYEKHSEFLEYGDLFTGPNITKNRLDFSVDFMQEWESLNFASPKDSFSVLSMQDKKFKVAKEGQILGQIDRISYIPSSSDYLPSFYEIEGWMIAHKADQLNVDIYLGLMGKDKFKYYPVVHKYRAELSQIFAKEKNVAMSGFLVRIKDDEFEKFNTSKICLVAKKKNAIFGFETFIYKETDSEICLGESL